MKATIPNGWYVLTMVEGAPTPMRHLLINGARQCNRWVKTIVDPQQDDTVPKCRMCERVSLSRKGVDRLIEAL